MTSQRRFEQDLPALLADLYQAGIPDYRDDLVQQVARVRQRPAWTFPERWLPMDLATSRVPVTRMPWRQIGVLALLALVFAAALVAYVGSQPSRVPAAPFGPAANGSILFAMDGDIYTADPRTGASKAIVTGPETDVEPVYSLDGTRVLFGRTSDSDASRRLLFVGRDDGSGLVQLTPEPLSNLSSWSFSPDGASIVAFATRDGGPAIVIVPTDGRGQPTFFPVFATSDDGPPQYRPDGSEIMFIGKDPGAASRGVYGLDPATGIVRPIVLPSPPFDIFGASWSPDGTRIAYGTHDTSAEAITARTHVVGVDGTGDVAVDGSSDSIADAGFDWSNDGTRLIIARFYGDDGSRTRSAIVPADGSSAGIEIACPPAVPSDDCTADWAWSPDDTVLHASHIGVDGMSGPQLLADPLTGEIRTAPWTAAGEIDWQRLAP